MQREEEQGGDMGWWYYRLEATSLKKLGQIVLYTTAKTFSHK
jgi:hypothetical protein